MDSGIIYPTIELGGVKYTGKVTRRTLAYRISKQAVDMGKLLNNFSVLVDTLHALLTPEFKGTPEDLAELITDDKRQEAANVVFGALVKVFPPTQQPAQTAAGASTAPIQ